MLLHLICLPLRAARCGLRLGLALGFGAGLAAGMGGVARLAALREARQTAR